MTTNMMGSTVYMKWTEMGKDGPVTTLTQHRCWDAAKFMEAKTAEAAKNGGACRFLTEQQYKAEGGK